MSTTTLPSTNGSTPHVSNPHVSNTEWLQLTTQQFFSRFNWDDNPPEVQQLRQATATGSTDPLSMTLTVSQFFGAINWDGAAIAQIPSTSPTLPDTHLSSDKLFTLDDFSDLF